MKYHNSIRTIECGQTDPRSEQKNLPLFRLFVSVDEVTSSFDHDRPLTIQSGAKSAQKVIQGGHPIFLKISSPLGRDHITDIPNIVSKKKTPF